MLWRVRTTLADRPGALAALAQQCGGRQVNILGLQIFPGIDGVTDELVLRSPDGWALTDVAALVEAAGGRRVSVGPCTEQALVDGPTRYLTAVRQVLQGEPVSDVLARLLDAEPVAAGHDAESAAGHETPTAVQDLLAVDGPAGRVELRRTTPFTGTEYARASALLDVAAELAPVSVGPAATPAGLPVSSTEAGSQAVQTAADAAPVIRPASYADTGALMAMHRRCSAETVLGHYRAPLATLDLRMARRILLGGAGALVATVGEQVVALATLGSVEDGVCEAQLLVEDAWQRRGLGSRLLGATARLAAGLGVSDLVFRTAAESPAAVALVFSSGMRARVRLSGDELVLTVSARGLAPLEPEHTRSRVVVPEPQVPAPA